jgi:chemotaxis protein methyltransferase CheR
MTLIDAIGHRLATTDTKLLATDLDTDVLNRAKNGVYSSERIEAIPQAWQKKWLLKNKQDDAQFKMHQQLQSLITFNQLNLLEPWPMKGPFDMIFCRNVLIYFDRKTQQDIIRRMHGLLKPGGVLALGHSESIGECNSLFENIGRTLFKKKNGINQQSLNQSGLRHA